MGTIVCVSVGSDIWVLFGKIRFWKSSSVDTQCFIQDRGSQGHISNRYFTFNHVVLTTLNRTLTL